MADLIKSLGSKLVQGQTAEALPAVTPSQPAVGVSQEAAKRVLQAGTAQPTGPQQAQTLGITQATTQQAARTAMGEVASAAQLAAQKQQQEEDAIAAQLSDEALQLKESALGIRQQFAQKQQAILSGLRQGMEKVGLRQREAELQQLGFLTRLNNDKYRAKLQSEGRRKRLLSKTAFREAALESAFKNQIELLQNDLTFKSLLRSDERDFQRKVAEIDIDTAFRVLQSEISATATRAKFETLATAAQAAIKYGKEKATAPSQTEPEVDEGEGEWL